MELCALGGRCVPAFTESCMLNEFCFVLQESIATCIFKTFLSGIFLGLFPKCYKKKKKVICFQKVIAQLKIMNMLQLMWKLNMSEVMWKTLEQTGLKGQMIPKRNEMKLLQKVLLLPVSGQFGKHTCKTLALWKLQENRRLSAGFGQWVDSWPTYTHMDPFWAKDPRVGCAPSLVPQYGMAKCPPEACSSNIYSSSARHTLVCRASFLLQEE